jgi:zinc transporter 1/2/3
VDEGWNKNDTLKIVFIFISFIEALSLGLVPVKVKSFRESPKILGVANAFSGGVFLAIALMHIMPE